MGTIKRTVVTNGTGKQPPKAPPQFTAWSYSRLKDYEKCPRLAKFKYLDKIKEEENAAMGRGSAIHKLAEDFSKISAKKEKCPAELKVFEMFFRDLQKQKVMVEEQWAFDKEWKKVDWFDKECWYRGKVDCHYLDIKEHVLHIIDHKTGKVYMDSVDQLELYAVCGFILYPDVPVVRAKLWYLDAGEEVVAEFKRSELKALKAKWEKRVKPMFTDKWFAAKVGNHCRWCSFSKAKGGPCDK